MIPPTARWTLFVLALTGAAGWPSARAQVKVIKDLPYLEPGRKEALDVYLPERAADDPPSPGIVWIHGGGWVGGTKNEARAANICGTLAAAGYVCVNVEYRLGPGAWPTNLFDCKNGVRYLRAHAAEYHVDPDRLAVLGGSAGGHLSLMVGLTTDEPGFEPPAPYPGVSSSVSAVVDFYGITDLLTRQQPSPTGELTGQLHDEKSMSEVFGATREAKPEVWRAASPVSHVNSATPPVLIVQGLLDPLVDTNQSRELDRELTAHGVPHELKLIANVGHQFDLTTWNKKPMAEDLGPLVLNFLRRYMGVPAHGLPLTPVADSPRVQADLTADWKFYPADNIHGPEVGFDDAGWTSVTVPHTWNAKDGEDGGGDYRRGVAWYRRHLTVDSALAGKRLYLQFDGVSLMADVYVNGTKIGTHKGGFARFCLDATDALKVGQDNLLSVRVDNGALGIPPVSADFTFFGGIYRPVRLLATNQIQISTTDFGSPGVFIDQVKVTAERADLVVRAQVESYADDKKELEIHTHVFDAAGKEVFTVGNKGHMAGGDAIESRQSFSLEHPHLWDGRADPYLYRVRVDLISDKVVVDSVTQPLGLRFFRVDPNQGFFLNGHPLDLHGVNRHQDRIDRGWAISEADEAEDFALIRDLGCSALRVSHYQQSDTWYQRCDRSGIVAWAEIPFVNESLPAPEFLDNAKQQLKELIRQNYNHPAICFWGCGNETRGADSDRIVAELANLAAGEDATRLSTYASNGKESEPKNWHTAVVDFNHYAGWYGGEFTELGAWLDHLHQLHPTSPFGISEYGAGASIFQHQYPAKRPATKGPFHPEEYQAALHESSWQALAARPYVWSKFIWCMFDFASDSRSEGDQPGRNDKGLVTYDRRVRKDAFFWYQANWSEEPLVYITSRRFLERHKPTTDVKVYANAPEVELALNGVSLGSQASPNHLFLWKDVPLAAGENHVAATSHFGNLSVTDAVIWIYTPPAAVPAKPAAAVPAAR